jgi:hypothetical protein
MSAVFIKFRSSCAKNPNRSFPRADSPSNPGLGSLAPVLGHRARDGIVQASVQYPKVFRADRCGQFDRQFGDGLTHVALVMHDLRDGEPLTQEVMSVPDRAPAGFDCARMC